MLRHPRMRIPEMGLEYVDRVAQRLGAGRDVVPELAFREQLPAGTAIGGEVHPANEAGGGPNRCASRMFVEEGTQESRTSIRTSRHTDVRNAPGGGGRRLFTQGQRLRCVRNGPAPVGHLLHSDQRPTHESERQVKEAVEVCTIHAPFNAAAPDFDQGKLQAIGMVPLSGSPSGAIYHGAGTSCAPACGLAIRSKGARWMVDS